MRQIILIPAEEGGFTVEVPSLPGCISEGDTLEEAIENIRDAISEYIADMIASGEDVPPDLAPIQVRTVEVDEQAA
jgi:predicted RNase H-like HicB family nuclease